MLEETTGTSRNPVQFALRALFMAMLAVAGILGPHGG
jgi:hypothetical protein